MATWQEILADIGTAEQVGLPLITTIVGLIQSAATASGEEHAAIVQRLAAAESALAEAQADARKAIADDTTTTQAAIDAAPGTKAP